MSQDHDASGMSSATESEALSAKRAAELLEETKRRAQREFDVWPPYLLLIGAVIFLVGYGAVWWSVRGQDPFTGPTGGALAVMYGGILAWIIVSVQVIQRATTGIRGSTSRSRTYGAGYFAIIVGYSAFQGALYHAGASHAIVYGIYPASAPWLFAGSVFVTIAALREDWRPLGLGVILIGIGLGAAYAGPVASWLVSGIGVFVMLTGFAAIQAARRRA